MMEKSKPGKKFNQVLDKSMTIIIFIVLSLMVLLVFTNAFLRYVFNTGIPAGEELSRYFFIWLCCLGTILAYREGRHVGVDLLITALKPRARAVVELFGQILVVATFLLILYGGWEYFLTSAASPGPATNIPFGFVSSSILLTALSILGMSITTCVRLTRKIVSKGEA